MWGDVKIFSDSTEASALQQIYALKEHPAFDGQKIRIMPDVHAGSGCVIGFTSTFSDKVVPNIVGVDIGCGVYAVRLRTLVDQVIGSRSLEHFDAVVRRSVPSGFSVHERRAALEPMQDWFIREVEEVCKRTNQDEDRVFRSLGTLGGGNHFIELDLDDLGNLWLVVHSGSRHFGLSVANYYQEIAKRENPMGVLSYLTGQAMEDYLHDMEVAQTYARMNRTMIIGSGIAGYFGIRDCGPLVVEEVHSVHNYINFDDRIIRKGAISAHEGEPVIIPFNMKDGSVIAIGSGNPDWNCSAPHGAGRLMGRSAAKKNLSMEKFEQEMQGIWSSCIGAGTLDESPMAYKSKDEVMAWLSATVTGVRTLRPVYNFKAVEK